MIWIVWYINFNNANEFSAAFSSKAKAEQYLNKYPLADKRHFWIEPYGLDQELLK